MIDSPRSGARLVLVGSDDLTPFELEAVKRFASEGSRIVSWQHPLGLQDRFPSPDVSAYLGERGISAPPLAAAIGDVEDDVVRFLRGLGRASLGELGRLREAFRYRGLSLWWWAEVWLYYDTELRVHVRDVESLARLLERERPEKLVVIAPTGQLARIARSLFEETEIVGASRRRPRPGPRAGRAFAAELFKMFGTAVKSTLKRRPRPAEGSRRRVLCFTHASMWRKRVSRDTGEEGDVEIYFDRIIPSLLEEGNSVRVVGVGPRVPFGRRKLKERLAERLDPRAQALPYVPLSSYFSIGTAWTAARAYFECWRHWRRLREASALEAALTLRGVSLSEEGKDALREAFLRLIPSAMRHVVETGAMLALEEPDVLVLYSETTALGRATIAAARAASVPSVALQHGLVYRNFYSRDHAPDEVGPPCDGTAGAPLPERTLVFGLLARQLFLERGSYRDDQLVVTGSPKFDALLEAERSLSAEELRRKLGLAPGERLLVVASRFYVIGPVFRDLVRAAKSVPGLRLLVKPHQAESTEPYLDVVRAESASRVVELASPESNLLELIVASDGLVTVDSFASSEALVLGRPVLVLKLPNNLQTLVDAGLALGARQGEDPAPRLRELLDPRWRKEFDERRARRLDDFAFGADGGSTRRVLDAIYELADSSRQSRTR